MSNKIPYRTPEGDMCDLNPNKICDNCMKCVNKKAGEPDYVEILADFDPDSIRVFFPGEEDDITEPIPAMDIDPTLVAEWEEKLRAAEAAEREAGEKEPISYHGERKKRAHKTHLH